MTDRSNVMSADPLSYHPSNFYNNILPYHQTNFWLNYSQPGLVVGEGNMTSLNPYATTANPNNEALIVYNGDDSGVARSMQVSAKRGVEDTANELLLFSKGILPSEYQLFGISDPNPLDIYANSLSSHRMSPALTMSSINSNHQDSNVMPKPLHRVPTLRQQHYHQRHHAQQKHPQANNLKNKIRFSATGVSSNCTVVRDTKMSLSSAPSSPSAGSVGGSLGNNYLMTHPHTAAGSASFHIPQYKGYSSSSSCSNKSLKISASSLSSYSSCSSLSSTPSVNGISPRKRRADEVANTSRISCCKREYYHRQCNGEIITLCSCEVCATDEVTAGVDDVTLRDAISEEHGQQQKRSKNDDDVVFVSAQVGQQQNALPVNTQSRSIPVPQESVKERPMRKAKKANRKTVRNPPAQTQNFPFVVPSASYSTSEQSDLANRRYYLRSAAKGRKPDGIPTATAQEDLQTYRPTSANSMQSAIAMPVVAQGVIDHNNNVDAAMTQRQQQVATHAPRYHTRSQQKKAKGVCKTKVHGSAKSQNLATHNLVKSAYQPTASTVSSSYQPASVIQSSAEAQDSKPHYLPTSTESSPAAEGAKDSQRSSSSLKKLYDIQGIIGVGGGGTVYAATRKSDGIQVAIKQVPKAKVKRWGKLEDRVVPIEFELLYRASNTSHTGVIRMLDWYERRSTYILIMERPQPVIDLFDYLNQYGALTEATARAIFRQIADAVIHCHANGVVHRDIKDENVLLNLHTLEAKLIDFGCGTVLKDSPYTEFAGTPEFYPPEWFTHRSYNGRRVDAWSLGVLLFTMVEAEVPFQKEKDIVECNLRHKRAAQLSDSCKHLIAWMLQKDQHSRPTIEQALCHPWFQEGESTSRIHTSSSVSTGVMGTDELYEKRLQNHQNGSHVTKATNVACHEVASSESPESPPRYAVQETVLYQPQTASCQVAQRNGVYHTECVAR